MSWPSGGTKRAQCNSDHSTKDVTCHLCAILLSDHLKCLMLEATNQSCKHWGCAQIPVGKFSELHSMPSSATWIYSKFKPKGISAEVNGAT